VEVVENYELLLQGRFEVAAGMGNPYLDRE